jgi:SET domain-containing protein
MRLKEGLYCELRPSPIHGIGVFAVRTIPKGIDPLSSPLRVREIRMRLDQVDRLPRSVRKVVESLCYYDNRGFLIPYAGLNVVNLSIYLNHHKHPNLQMQPNGSFLTLTKVPAHSELTMDYDQSFGDRHLF